jgi:hypothetical protein
MAEGKIHRCLRERMIFMNSSLRGYPEHTIIRAEAFFGVLPVKRTVKN